MNNRVQEFNVVLVLAKGVVIKIRQVREVI